MEYTEEQKQQGNLLPLEIWLYVFKYLDVVSLVKCSFVSNEWKLASNHQFLW